MPVGLLVFIGLIVSIGTGAVFLSGALTPGRHRVALPAPACEQAGHVAVRGLDKRVVCIPGYIPDQE